MLGGPDSAIVDANVLSEKKKKRKEIHVVNVGSFFFFLKPFPALLTLS